MLLCTRQNNQSGPPLTVLSASPPITHTSTTSWSGLRRRTHLAAFTHFNELSLIEAHLHINGRLIISFLIGWKISTLDLKLKFVSVQYRLKKVPVSASDNVSAVMGGVGAGHLYVDSFSRLFLGISVLLSQSAWQRSHLGTDGSPFFSLWTVSTLVPLSLIVPLKAGGGARGKWMLIRENNHRTLANIETLLSSPLAPPLFLTFPSPPLLYLTHILPTFLLFFPSLVHPISSGSLSKLFVFYLLTVLEAPSFTVILVAVYHHLAIW